MTNFVGQWGDFGNCRSGVGNGRPFVLRGLGALEVRVDSVSFAEIECTCYDVRDFDRAGQYIFLRVNGRWPIRTLLFW